MAQSFANVEMDAFVVMPNHIHGIVVISSLPEPNLAHGVGVSDARNAVTTGRRDVNARATTRVAPTGGVGGCRM